MHLNYYFFNILSRELNASLKQTQLLDCFTQNKNELCLRFTGEFWLRVQLGSAFPNLNFPEEVSRAKRNTADIFPFLMNDTVQKVEVVRYDRSLTIEFSSGVLLLKMHGNRGNIVFIPNEEASENVVFIGSYPADESLKLENLPKQLPSFESFEVAEGNLRSAFPVAGAKLIEKFEQSCRNKNSLQEQFELFHSFFDDLENQSVLYVNGEGKDLELSLLKNEDHSVEFNSAIEAMNYFFYRKVGFDRIHQLRSSLLREKEKSLVKLKNYLLKLEYKRKEMQGTDQHKYLADVIMANVWQLKEKHITKVQLTGFEGEQVEIDLKGKPAMSVAENYYRKSKNRQIEIDNLNKNINQQQGKVLRLEEEIKRISEAQQLKELKMFQKESKVKDEVYFPFHRFEREGFQVWVGKNARNNDELSFKNSHKDDLWLHAKDVAGSHVLIKHQAGKNFPKPVIEFAASLAAYYSKRKNESLVPVTVTQRKFIRKRKGDPAGAVVVEKESVLLVSPQLSR